MRRRLALAAILGACIGLLSVNTLAGAAGKGGSTTPATTTADPGKGTGTGAGDGKGGSAPADPTTDPTTAKGAGSPPATEPSGGGTTPGSGSTTPPSSRGSTGQHKGTGQTPGSTGSGGGTSTTHKGHTSVVTPAPDPTPATSPSQIVTPPQTPQTPGQNPKPHTPKQHTPTHHTPKHQTSHTQATAPTGSARTLPGLVSPTAASGLLGVTGARSAAPAVSGRVDGGAHGIAGAPALVAREISHVVRVVPAWAWILVGVMLALLLASAGATARLARRVRRSDALVGSMRTVALTDPLTGLLNRRGFAERLDRELARARRFGHPLAVAFLDVRGLKAVNDDHGHSAGDAVLRAAAQLVRSATREEDIVGRIGGDECAVALIEQDRAGAVAFARRIAAAVPGARDELGTLADWDVTVGVAVFPEDGETGEALLSAADRRLYLRRGIALSATRSPKE